MTSVSVLRKATRTSWCTWWQLKAPQAIKDCARGGIEGVWYDSLVEVTDFVIFTISNFVIIFRIDR